MDLQEQASKAKQVITTAVAELVSALDGAKQSSQEKSDLIEKMDLEISRLASLKQSLEASIASLSKEKDQHLAAVEDLKAFLAKHLK